MDSPPNPKTILNKRRVRQTSGDQNWLSSPNTKKAVRMELSLLNEKVELTGTGSQPDLEIEDGNFASRPVTPAFANLAPARATPKSTPKSKLKSTPKSTSTRKSRHCRREKLSESEDEDMVDESELNPFVESETPTSETKRLNRRLRTAHVTPKSTPKSTPAKAIPRRLQRSATKSYLTPKRKRILSPRSSDDDYV